MTRTLTTEQLRERAKFWREKAVEAKWESVSIAQDMLLNADAFDELAANREALPVGKAEITKIAAELVRGDYLSKLWTEAEKSRHVDTHRLQNLLDELHDVMKVKAIAITRLLTAPPAPAVPAEMSLARAIEIAWKDSDIDSPGSAYRDGWNACRAAMLAQPVSSGYKLPDGFKLMPLEMTDEIGEAIAMEARCCGGIALCIYEAALAAAPEGGNDHDTRR